jgi:predicted anti-sigma-YlaC factor YlaD
MFLWVDREREALPFAPVERHLDDCPECRDRARQIEQLVSVLRRGCCRTPVPAGLVERIRITIEAQTRPRRSRA